MIQINEVKEEFVIFSHDPTEKSSDPMCGYEL